jgi:hypothetical protein
MYYLIYSNNKYEKEYKKAKEKIEEIAILKKS